MPSGHGRHRRADRGLAAGARLGRTRRADHLRAGGARCRAGGLAPPGIPRHRRRRRRRAAGERSRLRPAGAPRCRTAHCGGARLRCVPGRRGLRPQTSRAVRVQAERQFFLDAQLRRRAARRRRRDRVSRAAARAVGLGGASLVRPDGARGRRGDGRGRLLRRKGVPGARLPRLGAQAVLQRRSRRADRRDGNARHLPGRGPIHGRVARPARTAAARRRLSGLHQPEHDRERERSVAARADLPVRLPRFRHSRRPSRGWLGRHPARDAGSIAPTRLPR